VEEEGTTLRRREKGEETMRNRESKRKEGVRCRKLLLLVVVTAVGLLAALPAVAAEANLPLSCTTSGGWTITVTKGPCATTAGASTSTSGELVCDASGTNTAIEYSVTGPGTPDHVFTLVHVTNPGDVLYAGAGNEGAIYPACIGDNLSGIGLYACHEQAVRLNPESGKSGVFKVIEKGRREPIATSMVVKKGKATDTCRIMGLGLEMTIDPQLACVPNCTQVNPEQQMTKTEIVRFKGCAVRFEYNLDTGEVISAFFDETSSDKPLCPAGVSSSNSCCYFNELDGEAVNHLTLYLNGQSLGAGLFGDGYISSGTGSCTTRVIGGKVYTWGCPCPQ
jgi:hypothetical protein